jgi:hypothetical protein
MYPQVTHVPLRADRIPQSPRELTWARHRNRQGGTPALEGASLTCTSNGSAGGTRIGAWCVSPVVGDLSCRMVEAGFAARWDRYWREHRC